MWRSKSPFQRKVLVIRLLYSFLPCFQFNTLKYQQRHHTSITHETQHYPRMARTKRALNSYKTCTGVNDKDVVNPVAVPEEVACCFSRSILLCKFFASLILPASRGGWRERESKGNVRGETVFTRGGPHSVAPTHSSFGEGTANGRRTTKNPLQATHSSFL